VALLADSGLRISEALRLRTEDVSFSTWTLNIRGGKEGRDGAGFSARKWRTYQGLVIRPAKKQLVKTFYLQAIVKVSGKSAQSRGEEES
jgi:integrase